MSEIDLFYMRIVNLNNVKSMQSYLYNLITVYYKHYFSTQLK